MPNGPLNLVGTSHFPNSYRPFCHHIQRRGPIGGAIHDLPGLDGGPLVALDPDTDGEHTGQESDRLDTHLLAVVHLGLGGPVEELNNVLGHLGGGGRGTILVLDNTVEQDTAHSNTWMWD